MFKRIFWLYRYTRFASKWADTEHLYRHSAYYTELHKLLNEIPRTYVEDSYQRALVIQSNYPTVLDYLNTIKQATNLVKIDRLTPQNKPSLHSIALSDYLVADNHAVEYVSAIETVGEALARLYELVDKYPEHKQDYFYRQLSELFLSGITLLNTALEAYVRD